MLKSLYLLDLMQQFSLWNTIKHGHILTYFTQTHFLRRISRKVSIRNANKEMYVFVMN